VSNCASERKPSLRPLRLLIAAHDSVAFIASGVIEQRIPVESKPRVRSRAATCLRPLRPIPAFAVVLESGREPLRRLPTLERRNATAAGHVGSVTRLISHACQQNRQKRCVSMIENSTVSALDLTSARPDAVRQRVGGSPGLPGFRNSRRLSSSRRPSGNVGQRRIGASHTGAKRAIAPLQPRNPSIGHTTL
jgi:hypothetical protein